MRRGTVSNLFSGPTNRAPSGAVRVWFMGVLTVTLAAFAGCGGGDGGTDPGPTAASLTAEGWTAFETDDLVTAEARFQDALALDADYADAYTGRGWVKIREEDYDGATTHFATALANSASAHDARAGRVLAEAALDHPQTAVDDGVTLLNAQPNYRFSHDSDYSASDVRWLVARAALDVGDYQTAADQLGLLGAAEVPDPEAANFVEEALAMLEGLRDQV